MRFTPEQVQQILQARAANGVRPNITPALAAVLNARAQMAGANGNNGLLQGALRPPNAAAAAVAAANMFPPQQRQMIMQQMAQQQLAQQQHQLAMSPPLQMQQRPPSSVPGMQQTVGAMSMSPQLSSPAMQQQVTGAASPATNETSAPMHALSAVSSEHNTPQLQSPAQMSGGGMSVSTPQQQQQQQQSAAGSPNIGMAQAQAMLAAQQAMQVKQMQMQQQQQLKQQQQLLLQQQQQPPGGLNQPQFAQYLSSLFPHQLAQISNQQRMSLLALRQQQQQQQQHQTHLPQQQQQQQFQGQLNGQSALNQQAALQALQQGLLAGNNVGGMNGLGGMSPAVSQQMFAAQLAQNMKNQQMLKAGQPQPQQQQQQAQQRPSSQANVNQAQLMRIRQAMQQQQQQQAMNGGPQRMFNVPGSQTASSPVMMSPPGPTSLPLPGPIPGSPAMSTPLLNGYQMSPPMPAQH
ncbi:hypothetical protein GGI21_005275, partial [Coemansia aciculifera]